MSGSVTGMPKLILRTEGLVIFAAACLAYSKFGAGWMWFAIFFLVPDLSMLGYLLGKKAGAAIYNAGHSLIGPIACLVVGQYIGHAEVLSAGLIWIAHVSFDRFAGYGLKYAVGFGFTHLGLKGRDKKRNEVAV